jgi:hypothetical protein
MRRYRLLPLILLLAPLAAAQEAPPAGPVELHGWGVPADAVLTSSSHVLRRGEVRYYPAGTDLRDTTATPRRVLEIYTLRSDSVRTTLLAVDDLGPATIERFVIVSDILEDVHEGSEILSRGRHPNPLSGTRYRAERGASGEWTRTPLSPEAPTDEQAAALREPFAYGTDHYPRHPVTPGDTWDLERDQIASLMGPLADGHSQRMTFRLDSTGTSFGSPAAYLSYGLDVTLDIGDGATTHRHEAGVIVRLLDRLVDVHEQRQGTYRTVRDGAFDNGEPYRSVMEGEIRSSSETFLTIPAGAASRQPPAGR